MTTRGQLHRSAVTLWVHAERETQSGCGGRVGREAHRESSMSKGVTEGQENEDMLSSAPHPASFRDHRQALYLLGEQRQVSSCHK